MSKWNPFSRSKKNDAGPAPQRSAQPQSAFQPVAPLAPAPLHRPSTQQTASLNPAANTPTSVPSSNSENTLVNGTPSPTGLFDYTFKALSVWDAAKYIAPSITIKLIEWLYGKLHNTPQNIYPRALMTRFQGYPLWKSKFQVVGSSDNTTDTQAQRRCSLRVFDVGFISPEGQFKILVNHVHKAEASVPLHEPSHHFSDRKHPRLDGSILAGKQFTYDGNGSKFHTVRDQAGLLYLPDQFTSLRRYDIGPKELKKQRQGGLDQARFWYQTFQSQLDEAGVGNGALYLITGYDATYRSARIACHVHERKKKSFHIWLRNEDGPAEGDRDYGRSLVRVDEEVDMPIGNGGFSDPAKHHPIFLRGYMFMLQDVSKTRSSSKINDIPIFSKSTILNQARIFKGANHVRGGAHESWFRRRWRSTNSRPIQDPLYHPSYVINDYKLSQYPRANVAATHDDEWMSLLHDGDTEMPPDEELVNRFKAVTPVDRIRPSVYIDDEDGQVIRWSLAVRVGGVEQVLDGGAHQTNDNPTPTSFHNRRISWRVVVTVPDGQGAVQVIEGGGRIVELADRNTNSHP